MNWRYTRTRYAITTAACCLILFARRPSAILRPQFFAEDGRVFFAQSYHMDTLRAICTSYNGYYHLLPRLVAEASSPLPVREIPLAYALSSLLVAGVALAWFYLPHFRHVVPGDSTRLLYVLLLTVAPNQESLMKLSYVQWYVALWAVLVSVMVLPQGWIGRLALGLGLILASWTSPVVLLLVPVWFLRLLPAHSHRKLLGAITAGAVSHAAAIVHLPSQFPRTAFSFWPLWWRDPARAFAYRVLSVGVLGLQTADRIGLAFGWTGIKIAAALLLLALLCALVGLYRKSGLQALTCLLSLYAVLGVLFLYTLRSAQLLHWKKIAPFIVPRPGGPERYFFVPVAMLYLFAFVRFVPLRRPGPLVRVGLVCLLAVLHLPTFRMPAYADTDWPRYARIIATQPCSPTHWASNPSHQVALSQILGHILFLPLVARLQSARGSWILRVPINPPGWSMSLRINCREAAAP